MQLTHADQPRRSCRFPIALLADDLESPRNVGALFRLADAMGLERLHLCGRTPRPPNPKIRKTARTTDRFVDHDHHDDAEALVRALRMRGDRILSLEITRGSQDIRHYSPPLDRRICLVVGAEDRGIEDRLLALSDDVVHVPMFGRNSSMNVATACAVALFELIRKLEAAGIDGVPAR